MSCLKLFLSFFVAFGQLLECVNQWSGKRMFPVGTRGYSAM